MQVAALVSEVADEPRRQPGAGRYRLDEDPLACYLPDHRRPPRGPAARQPRRRRPRPARRRARPARRGHPDRSRLPGHLHPRQHPVGLRRRCARRRHDGAAREVTMTGTPAVTELRLVVTAPDYEQPLAFCRDVLGLRERAAYESPGGRVTILEAERHPRTRRPACTNTSIRPRSHLGSPPGVGWSCTFVAVITHVRGARSATSASPRRIWGLSSMSFALATRRATRPPTA